MRLLSLQPCWNAVKCFASALGSNSPGFSGPIAAIDVEEGEVERHPICTKSLELNVDSVREMVNFYHGAFVDIHQLSAQAPVIFFVLLPMGCP